MLAVGDEGEHGQLDAVAQAGRSEGLVDDLPIEIEEGVMMHAALGAAGAARAKDLLARIGVQFDGSEGRGWLFG